MFHFRVQGGTAHHEFAHFSSKCALKFFTHFLIDDAADSGDGGQDFHIPLSEHRLDGRLVDFLHHERNGDHDIRLHLLHGLQKK